MPRINSTNYAYVTARVRVRETKLLNEQEVERMLGGKDAQDSYRVLNELDYSDHIGDISDIHGFQEVIEAGIADTKTFIMKNTPDHWLIRSMWYGYDCHNLKLLLKAKQLGKGLEEVEPLLMDFGSIPVAALKAFVFEEENVSFGEFEDGIVRPAVLEAQRTFEKKGDPQVIDIVLDKTFFALTFALAKKTGNEFLITLAQKNIDLVNISIFLRARMHKKHLYDMAFSLLENGTLPVKLFTDLYEKDLGEFVEKMRFTPYAAVVRDGTADLEKNGSFLALEKAGDDHIIGFLRTSRYVPFGPETVFSYHIGKMNDAKIIRMIMVGKLNGLSGESIRERLRILYA